MLRNKRIIWIGVRSKPRLQMERERYISIRKIN